jgi:hypothetical protein
MKSAVIYLDQDPLPARKAEFLRVARTEHQALDCVCPPIPANTGRHLVDAAKVVQVGLGGTQLEHLAMVMHGSTTGLLRPGSGHGLHRSASSPPALYSCNDFARAWAPLLADDALLSLCACLCARSPHWYLVQVFGTAPGAWGPESYRAGGKQSFAATLRDAFVRFGKPVRVRAHTVVGHVTGSPMLREFGPQLGAAGESLYARVFPGREPTLAMRRRWVPVVRGTIARDWLMGMDDATVAARIRRAW